jgi:hypothetical protein
MSFWISEDIVVQVLGEILFDPLESNKKAELDLSIILAGYDEPSGDGERKVTIKKGYSVRAGWKKPAWYRV